MHKQAVVVGAGIIGASVGKHLAAKGYKVTVLESGPNAAYGATGKSWAWLNANRKRPLPYRDLNLQSMQMWLKDYGHLTNFCGAIFLDDDDREDAVSYPSQPLDVSELQGLEPNLSIPFIQSIQQEGSSSARLYTLEGWTDPLVATQAFLQEAEQLGAAVQYNSQVTSIEMETGDSPSRALGVRCCRMQQQQQGAETEAEAGESADQELLSADVIVLAAGVGIPELAQQVLGCQVPLLHKPAAICMTRPLAPSLVKHMVVSDTVFLLQREDGCFLIGETYPSEASNTDTTPANGQRLLQLAAAAVPALEAAEVEGVYVGFRPYPQDGYPVLGWLPGCDNVYVAVTHSGMTLAPLVGTLVAHEVDTREELAQLAPYRPTRRCASSGQGADAWKALNARNRMAAAAGPGQQAAAT